MADKVKRRPGHQNGLRRKHNADGESELVFQHKTPDYLRTGITTTQNVMQLQRAVGNRATQSIIQRTPPAHIQRLPTASTIQERLKVRKDKKLFGKTVSQQSTHSKAILNALEGYNKFILAQKVSMNTLAGLMAHYEALEAAVQGYFSGKSKKWQSKHEDKVNYVRELQSMIKAERARAVMVAMDYERNPRPPSQTPKWFIALDNANKPAPVINDEDVTGQVGGGTHKLDVVGEEGEGGYFKQNLDMVPNFELGGQVRGSPAAYKEDLVGTPLEGKDTMSLSNLETVSKEAGIISDFQKDHNVDFWAMDPEKRRQIYEHIGPTTKGGINTANRDIAMSRLNQLLGAGVIARTQKAFRKTGQEGELTSGALMDKAQGKSGDTFTGDPDKDKINLKDPNLQRLLSRLQLIDALALQVDRNSSNYYIQYDSNGKVIAVTGIDNDMSFGQYNAAKELGPVMEFPGLSRFVDAELAQTILDLDPQMLEWALGDLLSEGELNALKTRLDLLQQHLATLKARGELLQPHQWDEATAKGMLEEKSSYYEKLIASIEQHSNWIQ